MRFVIALVFVAVGVTTAQAEIPSDVQPILDELLPASGPVVHADLAAVTESATWKKDKRVTFSNLGTGHYSLSIYGITYKDLWPYLEKVWGAPLVKGSGNQESHVWVSSATGVRVIADKTAPASVALETFVPVAKLLVAGPSIAADKLPAPGEQYAKEPVKKAYWRQSAISIARTDWDHWPNTTYVYLHIDRSGRVDGYQLEIPFDEHPAFAKEVADHMTKVWGKPTKRGKKLAFKGKQGTATAEKTTSSWKLEVMVTLPPAKPAK